MFSANENLQLRQAKRKVVGYVEDTISDDALDLGVNVMVMQVSCRQPGCVPVETAIIVVFPNSDTELLPGLPESKGGGSYKTKVLKPLNEVSKEDVLDALPPAFEGGLRTTERLCLQARDVMFAQITQIFGGATGGDGEYDLGDVEGRRLMAEYLRQSLQEYIDRECVPPEWGEPFPENPLKNEEKDNASNSGDNAAAAAGSAKDAKKDQSAVTAVVSFQGTGNLVIRRPPDNDAGDDVATSALENDGKVTSSSTASSSTTAVGTTTTHLSSLSSSSQQQKPTASMSSPSINSTVRRRQQQAADRALSNAAVAIGEGGSNSNSMLSRLSSREHAPGVRRPGCPCCDPDNPTNVVDRMLLL